MNQHQVSTEEIVEDEEVKNESQLQLVVFPKKLLNPILTYRMNGDFHLYSDAKNIMFNNSLKLGVSSQNPYKRVSNVIIQDGRLIISYIQLDFAVTPWEYVVKRLESFNDSEIYQLSSYIKKYNESLKNGLTKQVDHKLQCNYRAAGLYKYKYIKELDQFFISQVQYDLKLIEELGFNVQKFIESCLKYGIPEISLKQDCTNQEYYKNVMEFTKPLTNPGQEHEYYLYSHLYPQGLKTEVSFYVEPLEDDLSKEQFINFNIYYNYNPYRYNNPMILDKQLTQHNCISHYYNVIDHHFKRCGLKRIKL